MTHATNNKLGLHLLDEYNDRPISYSNTTSIRLCLLFLTLMIMWFESWIADKMMCFVQLSFHYDSLCCRPTLDSGFFVYLSSSLSVFVFIFIHSFIPAISIAPLQVIYYSEALPTTARTLYRSFTPKRTASNCR